MPLLILLLGCGPGDAVGDVRDDSARSSGLVPLTWYRSEPQETWADAAAGLDWALSQLGALPPPDGALLVDEVAADRVRFRLDLDALALPDPARNVLEITAAELEAHPGTGSDDLGRFLLRSLLDRPSADDTAAAAGRNRGCGGKGGVLAVADLSRGHPARLDGHEAIHQHLQVAPTLPTLAHN